MDSRGRRDRVHSRSKGTGGHERALGFFRREGPCKGMRCARGRDYQKDPCFVLSA